MSLKGECGKTQVLRNTWIEPKNATPPPSPIKKGSFPSFRVFLQYVFGLTHSSKALFAHPSSMASLAYPSQTKTRFCNFHGANKACPKNFLRSGIPSKSGRSASWQCSAGTSRKHCELESAETNAFLLHTLRNIAILSPVCWRFSARLAARLAICTFAI